jgi:hypothetical protein
MVEIPYSLFQHHRNHDGSWISICMRCFATAARANNQSALDLVSRDHSCTPLFSVQQANDTPMQGSLHFRACE